MRKLMSDVEEFHRKYGFDVGVKIGEPDRQLNWIGGRLLHFMSNHLMTSGELITPARLRASLIVEEVGELLVAMDRMDETEMLDALADLAYVVVGTAVTFNLPLAEAVDEVHRSNLTKSVDRSRPGHPGKGDGYSPPDLVKVLRDYRRLDDLLAAQET